MEPKDFSAVILAAGYSQRMGRPKLSLPCRHDRSFLDSCINAFKGFGCTQIVVVTNKTGMHWINGREWPDTMLPVLNAFPRKGRFFSLQLGLMAITKECPVFIHNVDNPFITSKTLEKLAAFAGHADYIRPVYDGKHGHPVLITTKVVSEIIAEKTAGENVRHYLEKYAQVLVNVNDPNVLVNINTPADYELFIKNPRPC